jgi:hypothetical protein
MDVMVSRLGMVLVTYRSVAFGTVTYRSVALPTVRYRYLS